jgi:hypothetical protein
MEAFVPLPVHCAAFTLPLTRRVTAGLESNAVQTHSGRRGIFVTRETSLDRGGCGAGEGVRVIHSLGRLAPAKTPSKARVYYFAICAKTSQKLHNPVLPRCVAGRQRVFDVRFYLAGLFVAESLHAVAGKSSHLALRRNVINAI